MWSAPIFSQQNNLFVLVQLDPVNSKSQGKGKWFELTDVRINEVKISSKALQGEWILLRISGDFELSEFELSGSNGVQLYYKEKIDVDNLLGLKGLNLPPKMMLL